MLLVPILTLLALFITLQVQAQTPGLIYKPAVNGGNLVMDPNGDGYLSTSRTGFVSNDETESEIPFRRVPVLNTEPVGDIRTGGVGGHTDFTDHPLYTYFDGRNMLFRFRLSGQSTASKGYSILIDSDNTFSGTGTNPGFEFEVLLATNFSVQIIDHRVSPSTVLFTGNLDQYFQKSIALTQSHGDTDYFYDIYVPLSAFNGAITASTPLRFATTTITSAQSGIFGTASDIGGVNDALYGFNRNAIWSNIINTFPATSPNAIQAGVFPPLAAFAPVVSGPIKVGATSISGTSAEAAGATINVRQNGASICGGASQPTCPTVGADGSWTLTRIDPSLLIAGNVITAVAIVSGKTTSQPSAGVTVSSLIPAQCSTPAPSAVTIVNTTNTKGFSGTTSYIGAQTIRIYDNNTLTSYSVTLTTTVAPTTWTINLGSNIKPPNGSYTATTTPTNGCESPQSAVTTCNGPTKLAANPIISPAFLTTASTVVAGTISVTEGYTIYLYINGRNVAQRAFASGTSPSSWSIPFSGLNVNDVVHVRALGVTSTCISDASSSITVTQDITATPAITGTYSGPSVNAVNGTSTEAAGTSIQVFYTSSGSSTPVLLGTTTVNSNGVWTLAVSAGTIPVGSALTAIATAINKIASPASAPVTVATTTSGSPTVTGPIVEGATSLRGTYATPGATIRVYVDGALLPTASILVASDGTWSVSGISIFELYAGARITATALVSPNTESAHSPAVVVQCLRPVEQYVSASPSAVCSGSMATIQLASSERGVIYDLYSKPAGSTLTPVKSGASAAGTGGAITLTSSSITSNTTFSVVASKISGAFCAVTMSQTVTVSIIALPGQGSSVVAGPSTDVCANNTTTITVTNTNPNYLYQLRTGTTHVGGPVMGTANGATIALPTNAITVTTTFNVFVTDITTGCSVQFSPLITIPPTGPSTTQAVTASSTGICVGSSVTITVATENNANFSYQIQQSVDNGANWSAITTTTLSATFAGDGTSVSRTTTAYNSPGTVRFRVRVTSTNTSCSTVYLATQPEVVVSNSPTTSNAGAPQTVCGTTARLNGNTPLNGTGTWTLVTASTTDPSPTAVAIQMPSSPTSTVSGLKQGFTYTFQWTISITCSTLQSSSSTTTTITTNCPSVYSIAPARFPNEYLKGNVLASVSDVDGTIQSAALINGTHLPLGVIINPVSGVVIVDQPASLIPGTYTFQVRVTDARGATTDITVTLTFLGEVPLGEPMPVQLVSFKAKAVSEGIRLDWRTASELNNKHFLVQQSGNGISFKTIGTLEGNGTSHTMKTYSFTDTNPMSGMNYYRLIQADYDGTQTKTFVVSAIASGLAPSVSIYPNPAQESITISIPAAIAGEQLSIRVEDMKGLRLIDARTSPESSTGSVTIAIDQLKAGIYMLTIEGPSLKRQTLRFVKLQ